MDNFGCMKCGINYQAPNSLGNCPSCKTPTLRIPNIVPYKKFCTVCNKNYPLETDICDCKRQLFILGRVVGWKDEMEQVEQFDIRSKELVRV
jgi:hypothetical protein